MVVLVIVDILTFQSMISCVFNLVEHDFFLCGWYQISLYICKYLSNAMLIFKSNPFQLFINTEMLENYDFSYYYPSRGCISHF